MNEIISCLQSIKGNGFSYRALSEHRTEHLGKKSPAQWNPWLNVLLMFSFISFAIGWWWYPCMQMLEADDPPTSYRVLAGKVIYSHSHNICVAI